MRTTIAARILGLAIAGAVLASCTSSGSSTAGPGPTSVATGPSSSVSLPTFRGATYSIGLPDGWTGCSVPFGGPQVPATEQFRASDKPFAAIINVSNEAKTRTFDHATAYHELVLELAPHFKELSKSSATVPGATKAERIEYTQESPYPTTGGDFPKVHGVSVVAEAPDGSVFSLVVSAGQDDWDKTAGTLLAVAGSLRLGANAAPDKLPVCAGVVTPSPSG